MSLPGGAFCRWGFFLPFSVHLVQVYQPRYCIILSPADMSLPWERLSVGLFSAIFCKATWLGSSRPPCWVAVGRTLVRVTTDGTLVNFKPCRHVAPLGAFVGGAFFCQVLVTLFKCTKVLCNFKPCRHELMLVELLVLFWNFVLTEMFNFR